VTVAPWGQQANANLNQVKQPAQADLYFGSATFPQSDGGQATCANTKCDQTRKPFLFLSKAATDRNFPIRIFDGAVFDDCTTSSTTSLA